MYNREIVSDNIETEVTELDTEKFIPIAVECLAILIKLNDTIEVRSSILLFLNLLPFIDVIYSYYYIKEIKIYYANTTSGNC